MKLAIVCAAAAAAFLALSAPGPAHAAVGNPGLADAVPAEGAAQQVHYRHYRHYHRGGWRHRYRARHCWNERVRVRYGNHRTVVRVVRRCGWR